MSLFRLFRGAVFILFWWLLLSPVVHAQVSDSSKIADSITLLTSQLRQANAKDTQLQHALQNMKEEHDQADTQLSWMMIAGAAVLVICLGLMTLVIALQLKLKKMSDADRLKEAMLEQYTECISALRDYLVDKKMLHPQLKIEDYPLDIKLKKIREKFKELVDRYVNEESRSQSVNVELDEAKQQLQTALKENDILAKKVQPPVQTSFIPYIKPTDLPPSFIKAEVMLSAGPRKDSAGNDTELGEDVAGILSLADQTFFWLLDGTSDTAMLKSDDGAHIFSSRLLAQNIGYYIQKNVAACLRDNVPFETLIRQARDHVQAEWVSRINNAPSEKKELFRKLLDQNFKPLCSTTIIMGRLMANGHLYALRSGDSKVLPFIKKADNSLALTADFKLAKDPTEDYDRISFRLDHDEVTNEFQIRCNDMRWLTEMADNIHSVFAFSDGIGRVVEAQLASNNPGIVELIRQNIPRIPQKTYDDKTLIILERVTNP